MSLFIMSCILNFNIQTHIINKLYDDKKNDFIIVFFFK